MNRTLNKIELTFLNSGELRREKGSFRQQRMINNHKKIRVNRVRTNTHSQKNQSSFAAFKYLIITTSIIFTFGGLGFGLAWRYGQELQLSQSEISNNSANSINPVSQH